MNTLTRQDPIEKLNLSARAYNALRRVDVKTIGELMDYSQDGLMEIKNMGVKSATEIVNILKEIDIIEFEPAITDNQLLFADDTIAQFIGQDGKLYLDISIVNLGLSARPFNCLSKAGISYASELMDKTEADLLTIPRMGRNSVEEIMQAKNCLIFQEIAPTCVTTDSKALPSGSALCRRIVQEIVQDIQIHAGQLYEALLPLCEAASFGEESELAVVPTNDLYDLPVLRRAVKVTILNALDESHYGLDKGTISSLLPRVLQNDIPLDEVLLELEQDGALLFSSEHFYERRYMTVLEYAGTLKNEKDRIVLTELLQGGKLEQIGKKFAEFEDAGKTKQQIGQIKKRCFLKKPRLREDRYALIFQKYDISKEDFIMGFQEENVFLIH